MEGHKYSLWKERKFVIVKLAVYIVTALFERNKHQYTFSRLLREQGRKCLVIVLNKWISTRNPENVMYEV